MNILIKNTSYDVTEFPKKWSVNLKVGKLDASFEVSKELCKTIGDLQSYLLNNNLYTEE